MEWPGVTYQGHPIAPRTSHWHIIFGLFFCFMVNPIFPEIREMSPPQSESSEASHQASLSPAVLTSEPRLRRLNQFLEDLMTCRGVPGLTLSVVVGEQVALRRHYGMADIDAQQSVTDDTIFCVASLTKAFTSILLAKLLEKHGYTWDTKVRDVLGHDFRLYEKYTTEHVTVRDLLLHRTGVQRHDLLWFSGKMNKTELYRHLHCLPPSDGFRSSAIYNNIMYAVAGVVAEVIGGKPWEDLVRQEILGPLGMNDTTFFHHRSDSQQDRFARQYALVKNRPVELDHNKFKQGVEAIAPAIGLCSTSKDMAQWMRFVLSIRKDARYMNFGSNSYVADIFKSQVVASDFFYPQMQRPRTPVSLSLGNYGLGWLLGHYRGFQVISHYGSFPGFLSMINLLPIYDIGIFTSINGGNQDLPYTINSLIHTYILDLILGETPWLFLSHFQDAHSEACYFPRDQYTDYSTFKAFNRSVPLWRTRNSYLGKYASPVYADLDISLVQTYTPTFTQTTEVHAPLRMMYGQLTFSLYPVEKKTSVDEFIAEADNKEWMIPSLSVLFQYSKRTQNASHTQTEEIVSLELPDFRMESSGNVFVKVTDETRLEMNFCHGVNNGDDDDDDEGEDNNGDISSKAAFISDNFRCCNFSYLLVLFVLYYTTLVK